jgi:chitosanase
MSGSVLEPGNVDFIRRVLSVAETGAQEWNPSAIYIYADDNRYEPPRKQITLSIGFTEGGGNLTKVINRYIAKNGLLAGALEIYLPGMGARGHSLVGNEQFKKLLVEAGRDPLMVETQKEMFDQLYLGPAFAWAAENGFQEPLSYLVIADSFLHSGSMLGFLMNKFPEKKPAAGGNERKWIMDYLRVRRDWLKNHSNKILNATVYRAQAFLEAIAQQNWALSGEIVMNGTVILPVA